MWVHIIFGILLITIVVLLRRSNFLNFRGIFDRTRSPLPFVNTNPRESRNLTIDQKYNAEKVDRQKEVDRILDKISKSGIENLTKKEKEFLEKYSND